MTDPKRDFTVHDGTLAPAPTAGEGHYFDQTIFDLHYRLLAARAQRLSLEASLAATGFDVDVLVNVTLKLAR